MRTTAERRRLGWRKAIRKKKISDRFCPNHPWYDHLHQYSKGKIHCSCPICRCKTNDKHGLPGKAMNWSAKDQKRMEAMKEEENAPLV